MAYTWSKSIDETSGVRTDDSDSLFSQNGNCLRCERGLSAFDNRHRLVISGLYDLPVGKGRKLDIRNRFVNAVLGGWQLGSIMTWRSGFPINPTDGVNRANTNIGVDRPDATGVSQSLANPTTAEWFNTAAFTLQPLYTFGNVGRNTVIGPRGFYWDFSTHKDFRIRRGSRAAIPLGSVQRPEPPGLGPAEYNSDQPAVRPDYLDQRAMRQMQFALKYVF